MTVDDYIAAPVGDGLLVARRHGRRLFALNDTARFLWERRAAGLDDSELPGALAEAYGIAPAVAERDVRSTLRRWREDGLLDQGGTTRRVLIAGCRLTFRLAASGLEPALAPLLAPLGVEADGTDEPPTATIEVDRAGTTYRVAVDEDPATTLSTLDETIEAVNAGIVRAVFESCPWQLSLHSAAVADRAGCVLLPGQSGSGKTTLLASLLARGFDHVADDLVLVAEGEPLVQPLPLALVLKRGSWRILEGPIPGLAALPVYRRAGQDVKYWLPPADRITRRPHPVEAIVFPRFGGAAALSATPLAAHDALMRLMQAPTRIGQALSQASVDRLAGWMQSRPAYDLAYDRAEAAADWIAGLLVR